MYFFNSFLIFTPKYTYCNIKQLMSLHAIHNRKSGKKYFGKKMIYLAKAVVWSTICSNLTYALLLNSLNKDFQTLVAFTTQIYFGVMCQTIKSCLTHTQGWWWGVPESQGRFVGVDSVPRAVSVLETSGREERMISLLLNFQLLLSTIIHGFVVFYIVLLYRGTSSRTKVLIII